MRFGAVIVGSLASRATDIRRKKLLSILPKIREIPGGLYAPHGQDGPLDGPEAGRPPSNICCRWVAGERHIAAAQAGMSLVGRVPAAEVCRSDGRHRPKGASGKSSGDRRLY